MLDEDTIPPRIESADTFPEFSFDILIQDPQQLWRPAQKFRHGDDTYVLSEPGQPYHLQVFNDSDEDIAVAFEVDGTDWPMYHLVRSQQSVIIQDVLVSCTVQRGQCREKCVGFTFGKPVLQAQPIGTDADEDQMDSTAKVGLLRMFVFSCTEYRDIKEVTQTWQSEVTDAKASESKKFFLNPLCTQYGELGETIRAADAYTKVDVDWSEPLEIIPCYYKTKESLELTGLLREGGKRQDEDHDEDDDDEQPALEPIPEPPQPVLAALPSRAVKSEPNPKQKRSHQKISQSGKKVKQEPKGKKQRVVIVISDDEEEEEEQERGNRRFVREVDLTQD